MAAPLEAYVGFALSAIAGVALLAYLSVRNARRREKLRQAQDTTNRHIEERVRERTHSLARVIEHLTATIARQREGLATKDLLLNEINHRVGNHLLLIGGILRRRLSRCSDPGLAADLQDCIGRIQSAAVVHRLLHHRDDLAELDLAEYLATLCPRIAQVVDGDLRVKLTVDAERVHTRVETAVAVGLIVSEVVCNAFKHAFPGGRGGHIRLVLWRSGCRATLLIEDDGVGFDVDAAHRHEAPGLRLVETLASQIGAIVQQVSAANGTVFKLTFTPPDCPEGSPGRLITGRAKKWTAPPGDRTARQM